MLELIVCALFTLVPDFLYRRFAQGKRLGREITIFSVWFELRWGLVTCLMLTVSLITLVFYFHPATNYVSAVYRSVPIIPETIGRVAEVYVRGSDEVEAGQPIFRLDDATQRTAVETARRQVAEVDAAFALARADLAQSEARMLEAQWNLQQAIDEYETKSQLARADVVARREAERLEVLVRARQAGVAAAEASKAAVEARIAEQLPAQKDSAEAALAQAEAALAKTVVRAGVSGRVEQFLLQVGDVVNPLARPAGVLVPENRGVLRPVLAAGFGQIEAQVLRPGMIACASLPWRVIPMVVTNVQGFIATGQVRSTDQLIDLQQFRVPGTMLVVMEPLYENGLDGVVPGSSCVANAYTSNHEALQDPSLGTGRRFALHAVDAVGFVHAILLRIQVALLPFQALVLGGGH
jgi:multidrug resistance efflux pump